LRLVVDLSFFGDGSQTDANKQNHRTDSGQQQLTD
jgi:hypothetical protein